MEENTNDTPIVDESIEETPEEELTAETDWEAEAKKARGIAQRLRTKLTKATEKKVDPVKDETKESSELDYSLVEKAFFKASGLNDSDEQQLAKDFAKRTGESLDKVLEDDIFQSRLEKMRTTKSNELSAEGSTNRGSTGSGRNSAEYWLSKLGPNDQVPSDLPRELREKIVEARTTKGKNSKMFYSD